MFVHITHVYILYIYVKCIIYEHLIQENFTKVSYLNHKWLPLLHLSIHFSSITILFVSSEFGVAPDVFVIELWES